MKDRLKNKHLNIIKNAIIPGLIIALCFYFGNMLQNYGRLVFNAKSTIVGVASLVMSLIVVALSFLFLDKLKIAEKRVTFLGFVKNTKEYYLMMFLILIILWIPTYQAFYPGLFIYDAPAQYSQVALGDFNEFQPLLHTLFSFGIVVGGQLFSGNVNFGIALSTMLQIIIFAAIVSYWLMYMYEKKISVWIRLFTILMMTVYPPVSMNMMALTKDNYFALFVISFILMNYRMFTENDFFEHKINSFLWVLFGFLFLTFRNNAVYAMVVAMPVWGILVWKNEGIRKKAILLAAILAAIFIVFKIPVSHSIARVGIDNREKLSIPAQQMVRVYRNHYDELTDAEINYIENVFENDAAFFYYVPYMADMSKGTLKIEEIEKDWGQFIKVYIGLLKKYPKDCMEAFLHTNYGMWYLYPTFTLTWDGEPRYIFVENRYPSVTETKFPALYSFYSLFESSSLVFGGKWYSFINMPALFFYFCIVALFWGIKEHKPQVCLANSFVLIICATFLLGPTILVRYMLFMIFMLPFNLMMISKER